MWTDQHITISAIDTTWTGEQVDHALEWYRNRNGFDSAICWYLNAEPPEGLVAQLYARGFSPNWQPLWMWCKLRDVQKHSIGPTHVTIKAVREEAAWQVDDLPYYKLEEVPMMATLQRRYPRVR